MNDQSSRYGRLIDSLYGSTMSKSVSWAEAAEEDKFQTRLGTYVFVVYQRYDPDADDVYTLLDLKSLEGKNIETITANSAGGGASEKYSMPRWKIMDELYAAARRNAFGVDEALDQVLALLESGKA